MSETKKLIIFSYGPVPTPEQDKVEGGGLRCWGLAKGLLSQNDKLDITVAYHESYRKENHTGSFEGITIETWNNSSIGNLISNKQTIVVSYCMGDLSVGVVDAVRPHQQLVLDCYVPIYVEISARASEDLKGEYDAFRFEVGRWEKVLKRGDVFLCASENQRRFYQGVLSGLGRLNPATYSDETLLVVPYGIYSDRPVVSNEPITKLLDGDKTAKRVLWFGAVYPWFDLKNLINAIKLINDNGVNTKLVIVGAKNPFNGHPDFIKKYDELIEFIEHDKDAKKQVVMQDWVDFNDRANWYLDSDLVVSINKIGEENQLAWRTRLMDYIWADLPILTNAGDPLGEDLVASDAAIKLKGLSVEDLADGLSSALKDTKKLGTVKKNLSQLRSKYLWDNVTKVLYEAILSNRRPSDFAKFGMTEEVVDSPRSLVQKVVSKSRKIPHYYKKYGLKSTLLATRTVVSKKLNRGDYLARPKKIVFIAHQFDNTGAPHVLLDLLKDFSEKYPSTPKELHSFNPAVQENIKKLNKIGISPYIHISQDTPLKFAKGDVVIMNTVAFSETTKNSIFSSVEGGVIEQLLWYVHEDEPEYIFTRSETLRIKKLLKSGKLTIFVLAEGTRASYIKHFGDSEYIIDQPYRLKMPKNMHIKRSLNDFDKLDFVLPGMVSDGRKGQLPLLYAFIEFKKRFYNNAPSEYRDFSLTYIGVGHDFLSRQILKHAEKGLVDNFVSYKPQSHEKTLDIIAKANVTLCYSMRESLPLFVYEGMTAGHPILRNDCSGLEEQLIDGENGYLLHSDDFESVVLSIETILNKKKTPNDLLLSMSKKSQEIVAKAEDNNFDKILAAINNSFN